MNMNTAHTTLSQIATGTKMAIGAHSPMIDGETLILHCGRGFNRKVLITLDADDTYKVETLRIKRDMTIIRKTAAIGVHVGQLSETIERHAS